jgi:cytochrome c oxidase subunit 2
VKQGDRVRIKAISTDVVHGIAISAFNFNISVPVGSYASGEFVADKTGTYDFFCSVFCGSGHSAMRGQLIVEPR